ncbi:MAG TPA: choice-of-anchor tandem repeat GloVer-containing protein [Steroidobacteraceae bacterium]|jgi:uncharacterized repeat protein (TIGR03803 family)
MNAPALVLLGSLLLASNLRAATINSFAAQKGTAPQALVTARDGEVYGIAAAGGAQGRGTVFRMGPAGAPEVLHEFSGGADGATPTALIEGENGVLYGATTAYAQQAVDGSIFHTAGTLFAIRGRGSFVTLTGAFSVSPRGDSVNPGNQGGPVALALGRDGALYGATDSDGRGFGTLFRRGKDGALSILHTFSGAGDGAQPNTLVAAGDGNLYGTTMQGGAGNGTVFRLGLDGTFATLAPLPALAGGSATPSSLLWAADGNLYGGLLASMSSPGVPGAVFRATAAGVVTLLQRIGDSPTAAGQGPRALLQSADGSFYGTTFLDGAHGDGTLFRLTETGVLTTLYAFTGKADGEAPNALTRAFGRSEMLIGSTSGNVDPTSGASSYAKSGDFGTLFRWGDRAGFETLYRFSYKHDFNPNSLVRTRDGLLYGTTAGDISAPDVDGGTVFVITPHGELKSLYRFTGGADGGNPTSLTEASDGNLYGRTSAGGSPRGGGTLFRMTRWGELTTLHVFTVSSGGEGSALVEGSDGNFYGTSQNGQGFVFRLTPGGAYSVLAVFPEIGVFAPIPGSLLAGNDGLLYGTTLGLSGPGVPDIPGTVFKLTLGGQLTTLAQLEVEPELQFQGRDGRFYGTTSGSLFQFSGQGAGTVFATTAQGQVSIVFDFSDGTSGVWPNRLIETHDGNIVGTTLGIDSQFSGPADYGSVFQITPDGAVKTLHRFHPAYPFNGPVLLAQPSSLVEESRGVVYGTTFSGGAASAGSVFKVEEDGARP